MRKCYYEILSVDINCTQDELKKSYKKLALQWHPDKNLDRLEEAKENFQLIQQAYEVLIDPQERAWYDRHRDDILRGDAEEAFKDNCLNVYQYFNTSCFKGYNDDEKGFYTVYRKVFELIAEEDKPFMDDDDEFFEVPGFGYSDSSYEEVVHNFYAYWQSYCTSKSYSWVDKFDLSEARKSGMGRQVIRAMEKENKKFRDQHKKMRNEEVRELVSFVRKRDKRVQMHKKLLEVEKAEKAKKTEELRRKQMQERNKTFENYKETEWSSMSQFEDHFNEIETNLDATFGTTSTDNIEDEDYLEDIEDLYCIACEKDFRSHKAMKNHENSKKHKENVALLKALMEEDELLANPNLETTNDSNCDEEQPLTSSSDNISSEALLNELIESSTKTKKKKKKNKTSALEEKQNHSHEETVNVELKIEDVQIDDNPSVADSSSDNVLNSATESVSRKKQGKKGKIAKSTVNTSEQSEDKAEKQSTVCEVCNRNFNSRNKLFDHLKESGHAVYKNDNSCTRSSSGGKKQKKRL